MEKQQRRPVKPKLALGKINKTDNPLAKLFKAKKKEREKTQMISIRNERKKGHPSKSYKHLKH